MSTSGLARQTMAADRIVFVLHEPQDLVNIAGVIRVMKNMALRNLRLVRPAEFDAYRIEGIAHKTYDVIARTRSYDTLGEAVADCAWVAGTTARQRTVKRTVMWAREAAREIVERARVRASGPVAIVFGREDRGLTNEDLDLCHAVVTIPTDPVHPSLNLQHAAAIMAYEIWLAAGGEEVPRKPPRRRSDAATTEEYEELLAEAESTLDAIRFFKAHTHVPIMGTLRELAHRASLDRREVSLLKAIAYEVRKFVHREEPEAKTRKRQGS